MNFQNRLGHWRSYPVAYLSAALYFAGMRNLYLGMLSFCCFLACNKPGRDDQAPDIQIISPVDESIIGSGGRIHISAILTDNVLLDEVHLTVMDITQNKSILFQSQFPAKNSYSFDTSFITQAQSRYNIAVEGEDQAGNVHRRSVNVSCLQ